MRKDSAALAGLWCKTPDEIRPSLICGRQETLHMVDECRGSGCDRSGKRKKRDTEGKENDQQ